MGIEAMPSFRYFPLMAKGLQPTLVLEVGGLGWDASPVQFDEWGALKPTTPFGQLPILTTDDGAFAQSTAIVNIMARKAGIEGKTDKDFAISQMLIAEGEDLYNA